MASKRLKQNELDTLGMLSGDSHNSDESDIDKSDYDKTYTPSSSNFL